MKVAIYTSVETSAFNNYNIGELIHTFPQFEYLFVCVKKRGTQKAINKIKNDAYELMYEKNQFKEDVGILNTSVKNLTKQVDKKKYNYSEVDKVNDTESERILKEFNPDIILQAGAGILKPNIFSISKIATLNVHHGFSTEVRGMNSTFWCMYYGLHDKIGVTCHMIDKGIDTGAVIYQYKYPYNIYDTYVAIQLQLCIEGALLLIKAINLLSAKEKLKFDSLTVDSYYFGKMDYRYYNQLKKNNFKVVKKADDSFIKTEFKKLIYSGSQ
jgi:folate-dependent phosphoribosylglycinamide formyltransferase PurN